MSQRLFMSVDETDPDNPVTCLHTPSGILRLTPQELFSLHKEIIWAADTCTTIRASSARRKALAAHYQLPLHLSPGVVTP